jgi:hypothetical protein
MHKASWTIVALTGLLTLTTATEGRGQAPEPVREETADQQGATAGEAPPAPVQSARTPAAPDRSSAGPQPSAKRGSRAALEHLARIEALVDEALGKTTKGARPSDPVGTTGTPMTEQTGEKIPVERAKLEEIRMHLGQVRTALAETSKAKPQ